MWRALAFQSIGLGLATAIGAALAQPSRLPVLGTGDGGFLMAISELETAVRLKTPIVNVIWENSQYGSIVWKQRFRHDRHHSRRAFKGAP